MKKKPNKPRNWLAVRAHFRSSAGAMKDSKKEEKKNLCRSNDLYDELEEIEGENK